MAQSYPRRVKAWHLEEALKHLGCSAMSRDIFSWTRLLRAPSNPTLKVSRDDL